MDIYVRDRKLAIALGKALFWDMQTGSDGIQACASCHFHAGADNRSKNQISPAAGNVNFAWEPAPDFTFSVGGGPNYQLKKGDFPFRKLQDPGNRDSLALSDANAIVSSQGIHKAEFLGVEEGNPADTTRTIPDPVFQIRGINVRQSPSRATPTIINAVFNHRQFWDGRAQAIFNGVNNWGDRDPNAMVLHAGKHDRITPVRVRISHSSLASQAVGPPTSDRESSAGGRMFVDIAAKLTPHGKKDRDVGRKVAKLRPLAKQLVAKDDGVLGPFSAYPDRGLRGGPADSYTKMIEKAFEPSWWDSKRRIVTDSKGEVLAVTAKEADRYTESYTLLEYNFALFFGLAIQLYEATLVSDETPFDSYMDGNADALTAQQILGLQLFSNTTAVRCVNCHGGAEFSNASVTSAGMKPLFRRSGNLIDTGFNNVGLRPTREDLGIGGVDRWGRPLSEARIFKTSIPTSYDPLFHGPVAVDGAFKTPGLRNIELTGPYFHTGSMLTLRQVIDFYSRGGDFQPIQGRDGAISPLNTLNLAESSKDALIAFLQALTDERVRYQKAPFDHPELLVPNGHFADTNLVFDDGTGRAIDSLLRIPAVGSKGSPSPLRGFLD